jgi:hypothetical protein
VKRKGVCYDVGRAMLGEDWRPNFNPKVVHRELGIIKNDLHCNAVRICGLDLERLRTSAEDALEQGLEVWLSPEMWDRAQEETLSYVKRAAQAAEELRKRWPGRLVFSVGSELTLFMNDIVEGKNVFERMNNPSFLENISTGKYNEPLNLFLRKTTDAARAVFHGQITYFSIPFERVNWDLFDFLGVDLYRDSQRDYYTRVLNYLVGTKKPVVIGEFGCCTYQGAEKLGGNGFMISFGMMEDTLNLKFPKLVTEMIKVVPKVDGHYIRDEGLQAREIADQLNVLDSAGVEGAFVQTFVVPNSPYVEDPRYDGDLASYSLVKSYAEKETIDGRVEQARRQAKELLGVDLNVEVFRKFMGELGRHGTTYPDMTWEPKESFRAIADFYSKH